MEVQRGQRAVISAQLTAAARFRHQHLLDGPAPSIDRLDSAARAAKAAPAADEQGQTVLGAARLDARRLRDARGLVSSRRWARGVTTRCRIRHVRIDE